MNYSDWIILSVVVAFFGGMPTIAVLVYLDRKNTTALSALAQRLDDVSDRLIGVDSAIVRSSIALEGSFTDTIRKVQAEIKSLEIVFRGAGQTTRENPESVDAAIRLAREGVSSDLIVAKTGLPLHAIESIISLHGRR
jgi:uncharacterized protein